jgi:uncharacterized protein involved in exopolysaccharide biosynthesis
MDTIKEESPRTQDDARASRFAPVEDELLELHTQQHVVLLLWPLWVQRRTLVSALLIGVIVSAIIAFLIIPKRYLSTVQLLPPQGSSGSLYTMLGNVGNSGGPLGMASDLLGVKSEGAVFVSMLQSRTVEDEVVNRFDLRKVYRVHRQVDARKILEDNTEVSEDRKSGVIVLSVKDRDPRRTAAIAHAYVEALDHIIASSNTSAAHRERAFLEERLAAAKQNLERSEKEFGEFASKNDAVDIKDQGRAMIESAASLQGQMIAEESQLRGLQQIYAADNFRVRSANARIAELKRQLNKLVGPATDSPGSADAAESDSLYPSIRRLPLLGATWADLYRQTKIQETIFEVLTKQYEIAKVEEVKAIPSVGLLDDAEVPEKKASPPRLVLIICGGFLAVLLRAVYVIGADTWSRVDPASPFRVFAGLVACQARNSMTVVLIQRLFRRYRKVEIGEHATWPQVRQHVHD